jgi:hypothetical protein
MSPPTGSTTSFEYVLSLFFTQSSIVCFYLPLLIHSPTSSKASFRHRVHGAYSVSKRAKSGSASNVDRHWIIFERQGRDRIRTLVRCPCLPIFHMSLFEWLDRMVQMSRSISGSLRPHQARSQGHPHSLFRSISFRKPLGLKLNHLRDRSL